MKSPYHKLKPSGHKKFNQQYVDLDYIDKLSEYEKMWMNQFMHEYYDLGFSKYEEPLHSKEQRLACGRDEYRRKNDISSMSNTLRIEALKPKKVAS